MRTVYGKQVCETLEEVLNPDWCAVLPIDLQNDFMDPRGKVAMAGGNVEPMQEILPKCVDFMKRARELGVRIIHVRIIDLPDGASDSPSWLRAKGMISGVSEFAVEGTWGAEFCEGCEPLGGEPMVTKHRSSAFVGTNLDALLRSNDIKTVVIIGEQTPGCVEATYRDAAYFDYYNVLIEDCVAARERSARGVDQDPESTPRRVHRRTGARNLVEVPLQGPTRRDAPRVSRVLIEPLADI